MGLVQSKKKYSKSENIDIDELKVKNQLEFNNKKEKDYDSMINFNKKLFFIFESKHGQLSVSKKCYIKNKDDLINTINNIRNTINTEKNKDKFKIRLQNLYGGGIIFKSYIQIMWSLELISLLVYTETSKIKIDNFIRIDIGTVIYNSENPNSPKIYVDFLASGYFEIENANNFLTKLSSLINSDNGGQLICKSNTGFSLNITYNDKIYKNLKIDEAFELIEYIKVINMF